MSLLNMKLSVQAFVSACSPRVFFFFGPLSSPQWIISLNVLRHYIHEPPLKPPPPFLLHHWPFLTTFSSQNFSLAVLCTSWFINCPPSIIHSFIHQKRAFYFLNTLSLLVSKFTSILNLTNLSHVLCSLMNLSRESMEAIFSLPWGQVSTHLSLLLSFFHHSLCFYFTWSPAHTTAPEAAVNPGPDRFMEISFWMICMLDLTKILCPMLFLTQPSTFTRAWDQHWEYTGLWPGCLFSWCGAK